VEEPIPEAVRQNLRKQGHQIDVSAEFTMGANCGIVLDPETGVLSAGADPRGDSYALAW
jgi:gamma-glutamyltranspeptidase / glutathione hydrolase